MHFAQDLCKMYMRLTQNNVLKGADIPMKICPQCHTPANSDTQRFCANCGYAYPAVPPDFSPEPAAEASVHTAPQPAAPAASKSSPTTARASSPYLLPALLIGGFLLLTLLSTVLFTLLFFSNLRGDSYYASPTAISDTAVSASDGNAASEEPPQEEQVILHNTLPNATITVDGTPVGFTYSGNDAIVPRSELKDLCQVRAIVKLDDGTYETAAVWYNYTYGNELSFAADYGDYQLCTEDGFASPSVKMIDVLTWAYYRGFLSAINDQDSGRFAYATAADAALRADEISLYAENTYTLDNFQAVSIPESISYPDGAVVYNAHFLCHRTNRSDQTTSDSEHVRTMRLVWQDGIWKVDAFVLLPDGTNANSEYAALP